MLQTTRITPASSPIGAQAGIGTGAAGRPGAASTGSGTRIHPTTSPMSTANVRPLLGMARLKSVNEWKAMEITPTAAAWPIGP